MNNNTALTMKVFNYKDKEAMMKAARLKKKGDFLLEAASDVLSGRGSWSNKMRQARELMA